MQLWLSLKARVAARVVAIATARVRIRVLAVRQAAVYIFGQPRLVVILMTNTYIALIIIMVGISPDWLSYNDNYCL